MRGALRVAVVLVTVLAAFAVSQPAVPPAKLRVAVADFEVVNGRADLGNALANALEGPLFRSGRFELYDRRQTGKLLEEFRFAQSGLTEAATQTLKAKNIDVLITGAVNVIAAGNLQVSFRFINVSTSQLQFADTVRAKDEADFASVAQALVEALSKVFPLRGSVIGKDPSNPKRYYVNVGFGSNVAVGQVGDFYRSEPLPAGGSIARRAGSFKVVELTSDPEQSVVELTETTTGYAPSLGDGILLSLVPLPQANQPDPSTTAPPPTPTNPPAATVPRVPPTPWTLQGGTAFDDSANAVAADAAGNLYLAGSTHDGLDGNSKLGAEDAFLVKLSPSGARLFTRQFGTTRNDGAQAIALDDNGNVYVAGETSGALDGNARSGNDDAFLVKFSPDGQKIWTRQWGSNDHTFVNAVAANADTVLVAGAVDDAIEGRANAGDYDAFLTRFDANGKRLETTTWGTKYRDEARGVTLDKAGNAYLAGYTAGTLQGASNSRQGRSDAILIKLTPDGKQAWAQQWGANGNDEASAVTIDANGTIWVAGTTDGNVDEQATAGERDAFASRFDANGKRLGTRQWGSTADDEARSIAPTPGGGVLVAGTTAGTLDGSNAGGDDAFLTRLDPSGTPLWTRQWGGPGSDAVRALACDASGNVFVAGLTDGLTGLASLGERDYLVVSFAADGKRR